MHKLTTAYNDMLEENPSLKAMILVAKSFDMRLVSRKHTYLSFKQHLKSSDANKGDIPPWFEFFEMDKTPPLNEMLTSMLGSTMEAQQNASLLITWLQRVTYTTCACVAQIREDSIMTLAVGHPVMLWLKDFADNLHACCDVGMVLCKFIHPTPDDIQSNDIPECLIRLPVQVDHFTRSVLPQMNAFRQKALENSNGDYLALFLPTKEEKAEEEEEKD